MPVARAHAGAAGVGGRILVFGGVVRGWFGWEHATERCEEYVPARDEWSLRFPLPDRRSHVAAVAYDDSIYAFGGRSSQHRAHAMVFAYSLTTDMWYDRAPHPHACYEARAAVLDGKIWVAGGVSSVRHRDVPVARFNPDSNSWSLAPPLARNREGCLWLALITIFTQSRGGRRSATWRSLNHTRRTWPTVFSTASKIHRFVFVRRGVYHEGNRSQANVARTSTTIW